MDLKAALTVAMQEINGVFAAGEPRDTRLEAFLYDDHLMVWSLTIGFALANQERRCKIVRVSEADKSVLSIRDG